MPDYKVFPLPDTAEGLVDAEILTWHIKPGDEVAVNQIIVEIETAKAAVELPCPWAGVVAELHAQPGETVNVGSPIVTIDVDPGGAAAPSAPAAPAASAQSGGEQNGQAMLVGYGPKAATTKRRPRKAAPSGPSAPSAPSAPSGPSAPSAPSAPAAPSAPSAPAASSASAARSAAAAPAAPSAPLAASAPSSSAPAATVTSTVPDTPAGLFSLVPLAKPPVRKLAKDLGVDLRSLTGSGEGGVITREDVEQAATGPAPAPAPVATGEREWRVPVKGVRKMTAQAMVESAYSAPHVTEFLTVDVTPMMELRAKLKSHPGFRDVKITPLTFAAKAVCLAAKRTPDVNAVWAGEEIVYKDYVHLGIAAATPRGLIVPKIRDADAMSLHELAVALDELTMTAREGKTPPGDMVNGTITITNVGVFGVDTGTPIINPGESAILALGAIKDMPWVVNGELAVRKVCQLALSFDHRVIDGQQGSQFLADVGAILSDPAMAITF